MRSVYNEEWLHSLRVIKESKTWLKSKLISEAQFKGITEVYKAGFYHPNFVIRILIFIATLLGLSGVTGVLALIILDTNETVISIGSMLYGIGSFAFLDRAIIKNSNHYKSGLTEALIYHACGFTIAGFAGLIDFAILPILFGAAVVTGYAAYRYLDLVTTTSSFLLVAYIIFHVLYEMGGIAQMIIPFAFILIFTPTYFFIARLRKKQGAEIWQNNLLLIESLLLLVIYLAGNYLVVRELTINLMGLTLEPGQDIPFAFLFYILTLLIPVLYLYFGIKRKKMVLIRVSLLVIAFSVFTFKYYYGFNLPEISLTVAGIMLLGISLMLFNYLKTIRSGFTRENLLSEKWASMNAEAFIISQTMGGNQVKVDDSFQGQGGDFGGGGSSGSF